jgi:hypothetical protein
MNNESLKNLEFTLFLSLESFALSLWSFLSTFVDKPLQITHFYAKQTQFRKTRNWHKLFNNK